MEQTITMMSEEETPEVGPNDIVIHLVNPYKCGICELEFLEKSVFKEHMNAHLEQIKQEHPSSQIVMNIVLPPETPGGVTVTRDILQLGEDGSIKQVLQPTNMTLNQVSPLRELEEAGVLKLEHPKPEVAASKAPTVMKSKPIPLSTPVSNIRSTKMTQPDQSLDLIHGGVINIDGNTVEVEGLLKEGGIVKVAGKNEEEDESGASQMVENKDGSFMFAFKGPNDEMQHIQIIRPEGMKGDLLMELTNVQNRRRASRGTSNKNNECDICGKILSSSTNLLRHKMYHSAERPFVCDVCNKGFKDVSNLKKHTMIHKRIFPCYLCKKSFLRKSLLALHLQRHASRTAMVKTGNSTKEVTMKTFVDDDGTRVEEMSMVALEGQTFEYKHRIVKADSKGSDTAIKKETEEENKESGVSDAGTSTDLEHEALGTSDEANGKVSGQKPVFTVTPDGLQITNVDQGTSMDNVTNTSLTSTGANNSDAIDVDDMPDLKIPAVPSEFVKMYQCGHCGKRTVQRGNMMRHLIHHLKEKPFVCDECPKQFVDKGELVKHKKTHTKPYRCPQCNGAFAHNVQLMKHIQSECLGNLEHLNYTVLEDGKTYKCDICRIEMKRLGNMIKHVLTHGVGSRRASWNRQTVLNPKKEVIPRPASSSVEQGKPNAPYYYDSTRRAFFCGFCSKSFSQKVNAHRHVKMHSKEKPYKCTECDRFFPCANTLRRHLQVHTKPFKCEQCSFAFSRKLYLDAHMRKHSEKEIVEDTQDYGQTEDRTGYYCKHCDKKLNKKYRIMNHVKMHHGDRTYECQTCNKCFSSQYLLMKHKKVHVKPFVCKICGETFTRKFFLVIHRKKLHGFRKGTVVPEIMPVQDNAEDGKEFFCTICGAPFTRLVIKVNHEKKCREESKVMVRLPDGKGYKCKICNKIASLKHNLMVHIRKHDDVVKIDASGHIMFTTDEGQPDLNEETSERVQDDKPLEKRPRLSTPRKRTNSSRLTESDGSDEEFVPMEESAEEDAEIEEESDARFQRTPGGYVCRQCRRKFTDKNTLLIHLESHGENQGKDDEKKGGVAYEEMNTGKDMKDEVADGGSNIEDTEAVKMEEIEKIKSETAVSGRGRGRGRRRGRGTNGPHVATKTAGSQKNVKSPRGQASASSTPTVGKVNKTEVSEDVASPTGSSRRPSRAQKMPSRFLE